MTLEKIYKEKILGISLDWERITLYSMYSLSVLVPLIIGKPQLLVGSIVNFLIVYSTLRYGIKKTVPILILPSLTAIGSGILFDGATYFLMFLTPFIIISNTILSYFISKKIIFTYILGILAKSLFLVLSYRVLMEIVGLPSIFITSSYLQFATAFIGVLTAVTLYDFSKKKN